MRLFTAIDLPEDILLRLDRLLAALRPEALLKWSPLDNLHITTKFIGNWPALQLHQVGYALRALPPHAPFSIQVKGFGWFPNPRAPRVLWAGIDGGPALQELARTTEEALLPLGIAKEERPYSPHLTLARVTRPVPLDNLHRRIEDMRDMEIGSFSASAFYLYSSEPGSNASTYRKLTEYPLQTAQAPISAAKA